MPILNYTTKIPVHRSVAEIQQALVKAGARAVSIEYDQLGQPEAVSFAVEFRGNYVNFRLPSRWQGVHKRLQDTNRGAKYRTEEHAQRVAWRIIKDWVEAQLAIIDVELATLPEVFLPYAVAPSGRTLYEEFEANRLLPQGEG